MGWNTGKQFQQDLQVLIQQGQAKQKAGLDQLNFSLAQFDKDVAPIILKQNEVAIDPRTKKVMARNYGYMNAGQAMIGDNGQIVRNPTDMAIPEGGSAVVNGQVYQGIPKVAPEEYKAAVDSIKGTAQAIALKRVEDAYGKHQALKDDKAKATLRNTDPRSQQAYILKTMQQTAPDSYTKAIDSDSFFRSWLTPDEINSYNTAIRNLSGQLRGDGGRVAPSAGQAISPVATATPKASTQKPAYKAGDKVMYQGKEMVIKSVSPDGKLNF
jgi:hypothetical protein